MRSLSVLKINCLVMAALVSGCAVLPQEVDVGEVPADEKAASSTVGQEAVRSASAAPAKTRFSDTPAFDYAAPTAAQTDVDRIKARLSDGKVSVNFRDMPVAAFINEVFGNILGLAFELDQELRDREDLVTVRAEEKQTHYELYRLAEQVLLNYGVGLKTLETHIRFVPATNNEVTHPPLFVTGASLPDVPVTHRTVFRFVQVSVVSVSTIASWITTAFKGTDLIVDTDPIRNSVILRGPQSLVSHAAETIEILDRPSMRGKYSLHIKPSFVDAESMSAMLTDVLQSQGFNVATKPPFGAAIILPMKATNSVIAFSSDQQVRDFIRRWAVELDQPAEEQLSNEFFYYEVKNTSAKDMADTLTGFVGSANGSNSGEKTPAVSGILVDENRNGLIFTSESDWKNLLPVVRAMDRSPRLVNVEVTVASVTLSDDADLGVTWLFNENKGRFSGVGKTDFGLGGSGFSYTLNNSGQIRFALNALSQDQRVTILSKPSVLVKSGDSATIDVGQEVPVITSQAQSVEAGDAPVLQSISYRKTGVLLTVEPTVHSDNQVDLVVNQEVSEVLDGASSSVDSPSIFNRSLSTTLTLRDGGAVILGGLIAGSKTKGTSKVPVLGNIPGIGALFSSTGRQESRSELVIVIQAYVVDIQEKDWGFNAQLRSKLNLLEMDDLELD